MTVASTIRSWVQERPLDNIWLTAGRGERVSLLDLAEGAGIVPDPAPEQRTY
ncbi:hypothetical protein BH23ACT12_BH23ACT12_04920 [soil metagenome]